MITVKLPDGTSYDVKSLLADGDSNTKTRKSDFSDAGYLTYSLSLSPSDTSGYNTCASASPGCRAACLFTAGMGRFDMTKRARIAKTLAFFEQRKTFKAMLFKELASARKKAIKLKQRLAVRLNVVSDIIWEKIFPDLFTEFDEIQFYDYTKHIKRMESFCKGNLPNNYHLTFSRSECNNNACLWVLANNGNVTVVFNSREFPDSWQGFPVVNGDETDLRFLDPPGTIVGLYQKGEAKKDTSGFVVNLL